MPKEEWDKHSERVHLVCFNEVRPADMNRYDYALLVFEGTTPIAYMTCREFDSETVYMAYGGSFPSARGTVKSYKAYEKMVEFLKLKYLQGTTLIENSNIPMLKFALKQGMKIIGVRNFKDSILLEHLAIWG
jgi:hypothetical protein